MANDIAVTVSRKGIWATLLPELAYQGYHTSVRDRHAWVSGHRKLSMDAKERSVLSAEHFRGLDEIEIERSDPSGNANVNVLENVLLCWARYSGTARMLDSKLAELLMLEVDCEIAEMARRLVEH